MKNVLILASVLMFGLCAAQKQPLFISKGNHNPTEVESFALGNSSKAVQYRNYLLLKTGESDIVSLFKKVSVENYTLVAGSYQNSCWNTSTNLIEFYSGKEFTGDVTVYTNDSKRIILYKNNCGNLLNCREEVITLSDEDLPYVAETKEVKVVKEVTKEIVVVEKVVAVGNTYYNPRPMVNFSWGMRWNTPRQNYYGGNSNVNYNNTNINYNTNTNNTNNTTTHNPRPWTNPRPKPVVDTGGPGGAGMNTNTSGPGGTGMNTNTGNHNGYGGPSGTGMNTNTGNQGNQGGPGGAGMNTNRGYGGNNNGYGSNQRSSSNSYGNNQQRSSSNGNANNQRQSNGYGPNRR